jgi:hypothetical protein
MRRMVAHSKLLVDQDCHALRRPDGSGKAMCLRSLLKEALKLLELLLRETRYWSSGDFPTQPLFPLLSSLLHPLAHGPFRHSQSVRDLFLAPSLLGEVPRSASAPFFPISSVFVCSSHPSTVSYFSNLSRAQ